MKSFLLTLRCCLEWLLGGYLIAYSIGLPSKMLAQVATRDYAGSVGTLLAGLMLGTLGYVMFRDAIRVWRRLRYNPFA